MTKMKASVWRALRALLFLTSIPLLIQYLVYKWYTAPNTSSTATVPEVSHEGNATIWDILNNDESISRFTDIIGKLPAIVGALSAPQARFTVYAPVNEAFDSFYFPPDPPPFFDLFIAGCHMGLGPIPAERLGSMSTVSSFVNGDIFFTYKQRISVQQTGDKFTLNHEAGVIPINKSQSIALNGIIHHVDTVLVLPNSTAHTLRTRPELSMLRRGLESSKLSESIYDTNAHVSQTIFAPTNAAFNRLGKKVNKFLSSYGGRPYLRALLKYHVVANKTLFSDTYWPHGGAELVDLNQAEPKDSHEFNLSTLHQHFNLRAQSRKVHNRWQLSVFPCGGVNSTNHDAVPVSVPDIITMDGVIHLLDSLLLPPSSSQQDGATWLSRLTSPFQEQEYSVERLVDLLEPYIDESEMFH